MTYLAVTQAVGAINLMGLKALEVREGLSEQFIVKYDEKREAAEAPE